ncbi:uncharacterized protein cd34 [Periophthalmus magnuspinnatus]|nr:uncharacterized protein cd34 [Periophthalmus magnuspinnatus]
MWRISGLSMTYLLVLLCALLLTNEVKCQEDVTDPPAAPSAPADAGDADDAGDAAAASDVTPAPDAADSSAANNAETVAPGDASATVAMPGPTIAPAVKAAATELPPVKPEVKCVGKEDITESKAVKAIVTTSDCSVTKSIIEEAPANWCSKEPCKINVFQDAKTVLLSSEDASLSSLASALQSEKVKEKLGVTDMKTPSSGPSVFVGILISGLLAAVGLTVGYFKCQRRPSPKGERLAEEGTPVDHQASTLASDAPLNPPPETPEKPSANGEAPEGDKTQPPPTNGHSTPANTADTEL